MTPSEERAQLVAPMELIGKAIEQLHDLYTLANFVVYERSKWALSEQLSLLRAHDEYLKYQHDLNEAKKK